MSTTTQRLAIDLERNEELAKLVADMQPGDEIEATLSIVAKDDKTLTVELEEVHECEPGDEKDSDTEEETSEDNSDSSSDSPAMEMMRGKGDNESS